MYKDVLIVVQYMILYVHVLFIERAIILRASPQFAHANVQDVSEHKTLGFAGQSAHVNDHGFHLATLSSATCAVNMMI